jgi:hypothetical protein
MTLDISRLYFNEFIADMPEWKLIWFFNIILNQDYKMCWGTGWEHEAVQLSLQMEQNWVDCYKNIIDDICSFDGVWKGIYAQMFPVCN